MPKMGMYSDDCSKPFAHSQDSRIAYGARCTWWDSIHKVGRMKGPAPLPCCPHCGGVLFEMDNIDHFWSGIEAYEAKHPGYKAKMEWAKGRCFRSMDELNKAYEERPKS